MIRRLTLRNWRAYEHLQLDFEPGATFVVAPNGVGKSSIVEGARYALFGAVPPAKAGAARLAQDGATSASVDVELPSGRLLSVSRPYPTGRRGSSTAAVVESDGDAVPAEDLEALLAEEYGADPAFLARLAMLHSSTVFTEARGLDLREHLSSVFGVDGLVAALEQTRVLAQAAKKTADSARKVALVPDDELAALAEVEARATELTEEAEAERVESEQELAAARAAAEVRRRHGEWAVVSDRYTAVSTEVAGEAEALLGRPLPATSVLADLDDAEAAAVEALDERRRRRAEVAGRAAAVRSGLAELQSAVGTCPVCRRPLDAADVEVARASHEADLAALDEELTSLDEDEPVRVLSALRQLRSRVANEPAPGPEPPPPDPAATTSEEAALERFEAAVARAAERRGILAEARRRREAGEAARVELESVTAAFERVAALEAASAALESARRRILDESIEPLEELLADSWHNLFVDRPGVGLQGDGTVSRRIGSEELGYEHFSDGEKMVTQLILRVLVLRATTRLGFFWVDEPLEHLDPDARRALAVLLARAPEQPSFPQVLVTTYEEPLIRRLRASIPDTHLVYVRPS